MAAADNWKYLGDAEKTTCEEYTFLVRLQDWEGYTADQTQRRKDAWHWLKDRLDCYQRKGSDCQSWANWQKRRDYIDAVLHGLDTLHYTQADYPRDWAPTPNGTKSENVLLKERCYYVAWQSQYDAQTARKTANLNTLQSMRQTLYQKGVNSDEGWNAYHRSQRFDNLEIATHHGQPWEKFKAGTYKKKDPDPAFAPPKPPPSSSNWRDKSAKWHDSHLGITESPPNSNCDTRSDGIRTSQDGCANGTWLRNQPWCGCWAWSGLYAAGKVKKGDSWLASVASIEDYAKAAKGPFKGWTTDGSKAKKGDLVVLFGRGQHVGTVRSIDSNYAYTWEGNTSSGNGGSQSNGGGSYKRSRSRSSETYGYALVRD
jgi:hypothetical protein